MVIETKSLFDLEDLRTIEFECKKCKAVSVLPINDIIQWPQGCANCGQIFISPQNKLPQEDLNHIRLAFTRFRETKEERNFTLRFSVKSHENKI